MWWDNNFNVAFSMIFLVPGAHVVCVCIVSWCCHQVMRLCWRHSYCDVIQLGAQLRFLWFDLNVLVVEFVPEFWGRKSFDYLGIYTQYARRCDQKVNVRAGRYLMHWCQQSFPSRREFLTQSNEEHIVPTKTVQPVTNWSINFLNYRQSLVILKLNACKVREPFLSPYICSASEEPDYLIIGKQPLNGMK